MDNIVLDLDVIGNCKNNLFFVVKFFAFLKLTWSSGVNEDVVVVDVSFERGVRCFIGLF